MMYSWLNPPPLGGGGQESQGMLRTADQRSRKVTILEKKKLSHPRPRTMQEAASATQVPRAKTRKQSMLNNRNWQINHGRSIQWNSMPLKWYWRAHRANSQNSKWRSYNNILVYSSAHTLVYVCLCVCVQEYQARTVTEHKNHPWDCWWAGHSPDLQVSDYSRVSQITY